MAKNFGRVNVSITASTGGLTAGLSRASSQLKGFATVEQLWRVAPSPDDR